MNGIAIWSNILITTTVYITPYPLKISETGRKTVKNIDKVESNAYFLAIYGFIIINNYYKYDQSEYLIYNTIHTCILVKSCIYAGLEHKMKKKNMSAPHSESKPSFFLLY